MPGGRRQFGNLDFEINPYGLHWSEMRPEHLLMIDGDGRVIEGEGEVEATARHIHVQGHRAVGPHRGRDPQAGRAVMA